MQNWTKTLPLAAIPREGVARFDHEGASYALYRSAQDEVFATAGFCTHEAVHLADGLVIDYEVECPKHAGAFDIRTGEALRLPACKNLRSYPAQVVEGVVHIAI